MTGFLRQVAAVVGKDLLVEWKAPSRLSGVFFFALAMVLLDAFAVGPNVTTLRKQAGGTLWLGLLLASTRSLDQSYAVEIEHGALEGMVLWPVDPRAMYYGKAIANALVLLLVAIALVPLTIALYDAPITGSVPWFFAFLAGGCAAIAAPGTLYALLTANARGASVLLPVLLFPLIVPALIAAVRGTTLAMQGDPMGQSGSWMGMLVAFNAVHWSVSGLLYGRIVEDA